MLGELLKQNVVVVGDADADRDQAERVAVIAILGRPQDGERVGGVDVGDAVGHEDHVVVGVGSFATDLIRKSDATVEAGLDIG